VAKSDGFRVLVDRLWPRGLTKQDARIDLWLRDIGPSTALRQWFNHDPARWREFQRRYHVELKKKTALLTTINEQAKTRPVTLLYSAKDEQHNQAIALRSFLLKQSASLRRKCQYTKEKEVVQPLRKRNTTISGKKIVSARRHDRGRGARLFSC
jgi:uncharacterized protein YeaO (DUF488 family)